MVDGSARMLLWGSMAACAREGLGTSSEGGVFTVISESVRGGSISWDATIIDGGSSWVRNNPSKTRVNILKVGGDFGSIRVGLAQPTILL